MIISIIIDNFRRRVDGRISVGWSDDVFCSPACSRPLLILLQVSFYLINCFVFVPNVVFLFIPDHDSDKNLQNVCLLIDLMGKSMTKKVGQMMWCGSYQNNRKTLDRVQQRSSSKLLSEYMILQRAVSCQNLGPFPADILDFDHCKSYPSSSHCSTSCWCILVGLFSTLSHLLFLQICSDWSGTRGKIPCYIS